VYREGRGAQYIDIHNKGRTMTTRLAKIKKFTGLAIMVTAVTTAGWSVGAGIAQADTKHPHPDPHIIHPFEGSRLDRIQDRIFNDDARHPFERTPIDRVQDVFFNDDARNPFEGTLFDRVQDLFFNDDAHR
jgi:hypothetical protein